MDESTGNDGAIGQKGRGIGRQNLDAESGGATERLRMAKYAYQKFYALCFWSFDPDLKIKEEDVPWVAEQLMKNGGREAWETATLLRH